MVCESETADGLNEMQFLSLTAGGAYGTVIQRFLGYRSKHSSAARISTHLNVLYGGKMKKKTACNFFWNHHESCSTCYGIFSSLRPVFSISGLC